MTDHSAGESHGTCGASATGQENAYDFLAYGRMDWYITKRLHGRLHYVRPEQFDAQHRRSMELNWAVLGRPVLLACGRVAAEVRIPGIFTRMTMRRCTGCCRAMGYPPGIGSPKNDERIRVLLGLEDCLE